MAVLADIPAIGPISDDSGFVLMDSCSDGSFRVGRDGVVSIFATGDRKVEFIAFADRTLAYVKSKMGYPAYYPVHPVASRSPIKAVLMDLDGTSVRSEDFWIRMIQLSIASLSGNSRFELTDGDLPHVSGHSVSEHLQYCVEKYCPEKSVEEARLHYVEHMGRGMKAAMNGSESFMPTPGLKEFLLALKRMGVKIALVTSGLYDKAWVEIELAFLAMELGDPREFYDAIITGGYALRKGEVGTLGELESKPHPWLYAEACRVGLGLDLADRDQVVGIEDSGAGVCSIRLAGFRAIGLAGGNIIESGTKQLCSDYCETLEEVLAAVKRCGT
ncbi:MAG TPA: HAD family phosphatase [Phycisphaerae bacterium]|nr:HAD family phosphatase [Phycisphaerae bacterium]